LAGLKPELNDRLVRDGARVRRDGLPPAERRLRNYLAVMDSCA
jgi:hypothetical protein